MGSPGETGIVRCKPSPEASSQPVRFTRLISLLAPVLLAAAPALALSGCGSSAGSVGASSTSHGPTTSTTASSSGAARLVIAPPKGGRSTRFAFSFTAPDAAGKRGQSELGYQLGIRGPGQTGCLAARTAPVPDAQAGQRVTVTLDPAALGGLWCQGVYTARVTELQTPVCSAGEMCPQFIRVVRIVAVGEFRVTAP
jgi:hypothetical protein